jgi:hypothetical protein
MLKLTREDWCEIYYALDSKSLALKQGKYGAADKPSDDRKWIAHLEAVKQKVGPDGATAADQGVGRSNK